MLDQRLCLQLSGDLNAAAGAAKTRLPTPRTPPEEIRNGVVKINEWGVLVAGQVGEQAQLREIEAGAKCFCLSIYQTDDVIYISTASKRCQGDGVENPAHQGSGLIGTFASWLKWPHGHPTTHRGFPNKSSLSTYPNKVLCPPLHSGTVDTRQDASDLHLVAVQRLTASRTHVELSA